MPDINPFTFHGCVLWLFIWGGAIYGLSWLLGLFAMSFEQ